MGIMIDAKTREWIEARAIEARGMRDPYVKMMEAWTGKGIGGERRFMFSHTHSWGGPPFGSEAALGILEGYFDYVRHYAFDRYGEANITVSLTRKGMEYFDSLPRLILECA